MMEKEAGIQWEDPSCMANQEDFVFLNGKRYVRPYYFQFVAHVKKRWDGQEVAQFFAKEFRQRSYEYYVRAIEAGRIKIAGKKVDPTFRLKDSQTIVHFVHRHEPPVLAGPVEVLEESPDVITVCKPGSMPVHPCGQYRKNTVLSILQAEHNYGKLFPIHRLDRLVSGLLILARSPTSADKFRQDIEAGVVQKEYVAKVKGIFPEGEIELNAPVAYNSVEGRSHVEFNVSVEEAKAAVKEQISKRKERKKRRDTLGKVNEGEEVIDTRQNPKDACTRFRLLGTNGDSSIVLCMPKTGRTHQIRVHLEHLGHPIANDFLYLTKEGFRSKTGTTANEAARIALKKEKLEELEATKTKKVDEIVEEKLVPNLERTKSQPISPERSERDEEKNDLVVTFLRGRENPEEPVGKAPRLDLGEREVERENMVQEGEIDGSLRSGEGGVERENMVQKGEIDGSLRGSEGEVERENMVQKGEIDGSFRGSEGKRLSPEVPLEKSSAGDLEERESVVCMGEMGGNKREGGQDKEDGIGRESGNVREGEREISLPSTELTHEGKEKFLEVDLKMDVTSRSKFDALSAGVVTENMKSGTENGEKNGTKHGTEMLFDIDSMCTQCPDMGASGYEEEQESLWLHCIRYSGSDWSYSCPFPQWAGSVVLP